VIGRCSRSGQVYNSQTNTNSCRMLTAMFADHDRFADECWSFQWDVHILIAGTLDASTAYLDINADKELAKIEEWIEKPTSAEYQEHLVDQHVEVLARNAEQLRFLRNMALVALASRLTHSLRTMARLAETFSPWKKSYGQGHMSEFSRLWAEYRERFGIDPDALAARIGFVEPMREVRNQIVHEGSEANTLKPFAQIDMTGDDSGWLDMAFSMKYPENVDGAGMGAEVSVSPELLNKNIKAAIGLVLWLAGELRRELASVTTNT
jgi:hypothetical protein